MNWKNEAIRDLKTYGQRKKAVEGLKERIRLAEEKLTGLKGISTEAPVKGGLSRQEERWLEGISEKERLSFSLKITEALIRLTDEGLSVLNARERLVLEEFYINPRENHVERLCRELNYEKSRVYQIKDSAVTKFTLAMYGTVEL